MPKLVKEEEVNRIINAVNDAIGDLDDAEVAIGELRDRLKRLRKSLDKVPAEIEDIEQDMIIVNYD